jgi:putative DNA methylase
VSEGLSKKKKLIEVAPFLPLDAISVASRADKGKKDGTIKNVHKWFAPMPAPALRALIFAALVDAPTDESERARLLAMVARLVPSDGNPPDDAVLTEAAAEIRKCSDGDLPTIFDPFCGGGSTLVEAQRLGLPVAGSDLNPVAAIITRTLTELIPGVAGRAALTGGGARLGPLGGESLEGVISDVRYYADRVRDRVWSQIGNLYPRGANAQKIIAWLWARTVACPNPACRVDMPLISNLWLSKRAAAKRWLDVRPLGREIRIDVSSGEPGPGEPLKLPGTRPKFRCPRCKEGIAEESYLREEGANGRMGLTPLVAVLDRSGVRTFETFANSDVPAVPNSSMTLDIPLTANPRWFSPPSYGLTTHEDIYLPRQLVMLETFGKAIADVPAEVIADGGDEIYAATITSILGLGLGKLAQSNSTQVRWNVRASGSSKAEPAFGRHAMPMMWDFAEVNPFAGSVGDWKGQIESIVRGIRSLPKAAQPSRVFCEDARVAASRMDGLTVVITDPPYFDQIGYADLSDYFYVWHRLALRDVHPDLYATIVAPKDAELIATPYRHNGSKGEAARYFVSGFTETFRSLRSKASSDHPLLIVYAHRQEESSSLGNASTGWDAMLEAVLNAGLTIEGTLPIHGANKSKLIGIGTNALASYIVMVCRPRGVAPSPATLADFRATLRLRLPAAVGALLGTGESMVDIRQAAIGPGMEVFSQYSQVFDGSNPIRVRRALTIINEELGRLLDEQLGVVDDETRWAYQWYSEHAFDRGEYDEGRKLAAVYGLGVDGLEKAGIVEQGRSKVRLLSRAELPRNWNGDGRIPTWEACQHLVRRVGEGEEAAGRLLASLGDKAWGVRELAQSLTNLAIEKGWSDEAIAYDALVKSWPRIEELARQGDSEGGQLFKVGDSG